MNIYFADIFCEICTPGNYKTPNDYTKVNLLLLRDMLFNLYIILKPKLIYEIAVQYPRSYLLILSIIISNCCGVIAEVW